MNDKEFLMQIKNVALQHDNRAEVILFGSRARGDWKPESDWDVLVLTERPFRTAEKHALIDDVYDIELKYAQAVSIIQIEKKRWHDWEIKSLYQNVMKEGITL